MFLHVLLSKFVLGPVILRGCRGRFVGGAQEGERLVSQEGKGSSNRAQQARISVLVMMGFHCYCAGWTWLNRAVLVVVKV